MKHYLFQLLATINFQGWLFKLLTIAFIWFAPAMESFFLLMFLVVGDTVTGIFKAIKNGETYTSKGLVPTIKKLGLYALLTVVFHSLQVNHLKDTIQAFNVLMSIPIIREVTSIAENIEINLWHQPLSY